MSGNYRDEIAAEIIARIEAGTAPWLKPWTAGALGAAPLNPITGKPYRGINSLWLYLQGHSDPRWLTYRQAAELGGQVRKGEKSTTIEYWQWTERTAVKDSEGKPVLDAEGREQYETVRLERPKVFYAKVFNAEQIDGLQPWKAPAPVAIPQLLERAETMIAGAGVPVLHDQNDRAFYRPSTDKIHLPPVASFKNQVAYYETVLHELGHATGHQSRLNREFGPFGGEVYAREELRAEIASYMLAKDLGISFDPSNHAAYVKSWLKVLTEDKNEIFRAARDAEIIKTWVMEPERRQELERTGQVVSVEKPIREEMSMTAAAVAAWNSGRTKEYTEWQELGSGYAVRESTTHPVREIRAPGGQVLVDGIDSNGKHYNEYEFSSTNPLARGEMAWVDQAQNYISGLELPKVGSAFEKASREQNLSQKPLPHREREAVGQVEKGGQPPAQSPRVYLDVPFSQKDAAKAAGARWDKDAKSWYITTADDPKHFAQWQKAPTREAPPQALKMDAGTLYVGWHTPTIPGMEAVVASQSAGLPLGKYVALDRPFESNAHDPAAAKAVEVHLVKVYDPEGILDPANIQRDQGVWDAMGAAMDKDPGIANARNFNEVKQRSAEAQTNFLRSNGYEGWVRWIDGIDRHEDPEMANRELIVFDRERVKDRQAPEQRQVAAQDIPAELRLYVQAVEKAGTQAERGEALTDLIMAVGDLPLNRQVEVLPTVEKYGISRASVDEYMKFSGRDAFEDAATDRAIAAMEVRQRDELKATPTTRAYIAVPYSERNEAKAAGAKWDRAAKSWYAPEGSDPGAFSKWAGKSASRNEMSPKEEFAEFLKANDLKLDGDPEMDGKWHRVPTSTDKGREKSGSYRGFLDGRPAGQAKAGWNAPTVQWVSTGVALTDEERARVQAEAAQVRADREANRQAAADKAAKTAYGIWQNLPDSPAMISPYLARKGVGAHGVKIDGEGKLVVPARDANGKLWTLQFIGKDGKLWLKDSQKVGSMHVIEPTGKGTLDSLRPNDPVIIAEGYATGARIFEATKRPVVIAFDCGNLQAVAEAVHAKFPDRPILLAGDNDHARVNAAGMPENIGVIKAEAAAKAVGGHVVTPKFTPQEMVKGLTDFDDLGKSRGNAAVRQSIEGALSKSQGQERGIA